MQSTDTPTAYGQAPGTDRPGSVTGAAIIFLVLGVIVCLFGVLALLAGAFVGGAGGGIPGLGAGVAGGIGAIAAVFGIIVLAFGVLQIVTGINLFGGKSWARILGFVLAAIGLLISVLSLLGSFSPTAQVDFATGATTTGGPNVVGIIIWLLVVAAYAYSIYALATAGRYFNR